MRQLIFLLATLSCFAVYGQDDDYFPSEEEKSKKLKRNELPNDRFPHHEKLTLQVFGDIGVAQVNDLYGVFEKSRPGFGWDAGLGFKVRVYHKLSFVLGGTYGSKLWDVEFNAIDPLGNQGYAKEKGRAHYVGAYLKVQLDFTRKFWMALHLEQTFPIKFEGKDQTYTVGGVVYSWPDPSRTSFNGGLLNQFDIGINIGMNFLVMEPMGLRPFFGLIVGTQGFAKTGARGNKLPFGNEGEINPSLIHLKLGVIFDIPLLPAKPASTMKRK